MPACSPRFRRRSRCSRTIRMHYGTDSIRRSYHGCLGETNSSRTRSRVFLVLTNVVAIGCLLWTLRDAHLGEFKDDLATMNWWWVAVAVVAELATYFWHGLRWRLLLRPVVPIKFWQAVQAIYIGLFVNEV